jgi:hypothetical protein
MTRVSDPATPSVWQWFTRPVRIELRVSPLGALALGLLLAVGLALFVAPPAPAPPPVPAHSVPTR